MSVDTRDLLLKMKEHDFVYDSKIGKMVNKNHEEDKDYVFKILDLLYKNFHRVKYVDDLSPSVIGKNKWGILISQKYAVMDKRFPLPQVPFSIQYDGLMGSLFRGKPAYLMLIGFLQETEEEIYVSLNFKDEEYRKIYKKLSKDNELKSKIK
ncbi:hypothetical protein ACM6Q7_06785 [Peribacillus butanolivorans]|uniref:hypothetical protein n=1 Tax=Peribacillus butanolivorans TaxID=421767 RepID=UPI0039FCA226